MSRWTRPFSNRSPVPLAPRRRSFAFGDRPPVGTAPTDMLTYMDAYGTDAVVHPIVARLAEGVAAAEWKLWNKSKTGDPQDRTEVVSHAVLDLLDHPNDFQTWHEVVESGQQHFDLVGETDIVLGMQPGIKIPLDMWVLRPDRIAPVPDPHKFLKGWVYTAPGDGEKIPIATRELLRMRQPHPSDPYRGMGAIQALLRDLDSQRYGKEWLASFFANSAQPGGMLSVDRRLTDEEFDELAARWDAQHRGVSKAHRVAILEQAEWVTNAFSIKDLQMAELDSAGRDKALVAFGFPKSALGIVEDVNRANAEAGEYLFARWLIRPRLVRWREMLNTRLLPLYGPSAAGLEFDFTDPVPENTEQGVAELAAKGTLLTSLVQAGFDAAAVLDFLDWPDIPYEKPEPAPIRVPSSTGAAIEQEPQDALVLASLLGERGIDMAMRWKVVGNDDGSACEPCKKNFGKLYRSRSAAYADYPGGSGYIKCVGAEFGNECRCKVVKRRDGR